jgi:hypothetical protein
MNKDIACRPARGGSARGMRSEDRISGRGRNRTGSSVHCGAGRGTVLYYNNYHYHYRNDRWYYSNSRSGPWVDLPRDRYPKEVGFKGRGDERGRGEKRGDDQRDRY